MKAIDANVLVRVPVQDDVAPARRAERFLLEECSVDPLGWVNRVVTLAGPVVIAVGVELRW